MTFTEFGPNSRASVPEHNRLRGLDQGDPHPQYAIRATEPLGVKTVDGSPTSTGAVALSFSSETVRLTTTAIVTAGDRRYRIVGYITRGGGSDNHIRVRVRRGADTSGAELGLIDVGRSAVSGRMVVPFVAYDTPGAASSQQWCVTFETDTGVADLYNPSLVAVEDVGAVR